MEKSIIYGKNTVEEALKNNAVTHVFFTSITPKNEKQYKKIQEYIHKYHIPYEVKEVPKSIKEQNHQGVYAYCKPFEYKDVHYIERTEGAFLILDEIQDPQNFGNLIRSAAASNFSGIVISENRQVEVTGTVMKIASGTIFQIPIIKVSNIKTAIETIQRTGGWVFATHLYEDARPVYEEKLIGKIGIVLGNEGKGVKPSVLKLCDGNIYIPIHPQVESLNVATAGAMLMYEVLRQQHIYSNEK